MFIDASALLAMLTGEEDSEALALCLAGAGERKTSGIAVFETVAAVARKLSYSIDEARVIVAQFMEMTSIELVQIGSAETEATLNAFERFGKGRHPAGLNLGDCFAYGCARTIGTELLFKGDDFGMTDIPAAME